MPSVSYAQPNSPGAFASTIGWIDLSQLPTPFPTGSSHSITNTIPGGYTISFDIANLIPTGSIAGLSLTTSTAPVYGGIPFGTTGYTGIPEPIVLWGTNPPNAGGTLIQITNIVVRDSNNQLIDNFNFIVADAEQTTQPDNLIFTTNGTGWKLVDELDSTTTPTIYPVIETIGTTIVKIIPQTGAVNPPNVASAVLSTEHPDEVSVVFTLTPNTSQGVAFGIIINPSVSCCLDVDISPDNLIIYVCPGRAQFYKIKPKNCSGAVVLQYEGKNYDPTLNKIIGNLGTYTLLSDGILVETRCNIQSGTTDILPFQISDDSCTKNYTMNAVFTYSLSECCKSPKRC